MEIPSKIMDSLKRKRGNISEIKITEETNKDGINLFYARVSKFEAKKDDKYSNMATYYAFDPKGNYVGAVIVVVEDLNTVEMEYYADAFYKHKGNIRIVAKEVIKEIFEEKVFDLLKVDNNVPRTNIEKIKVVINENNYDSLKLALKLGFDENGYLSIDDYREAYQKRLGI